MGYVILENDDTLRLAAEVTRRLADGWKPLGGVSCYYHARDQSARYAQAMVRESASQGKPGGTPTSGPS